MSAPAEILRILGCLNPRLINTYNPRFPIKEMDIAHALGTIRGNPGVALSGRVKWARQYEFLPDLKNQLATTWFSENRHYKTPQAYIGADMLRKLAFNAISEFENNTLCPVCHGKATFKSGDLIHDCEKCGGTGQFNPESNKTSLDGYWRTIYDEQLSILNRWENRLITALSVSFPGIAYEIELGDNAGAMLTRKSG